MWRELLGWRWLFVGLAFTCTGPIFSSTDVLPKGRFLTGFYFLRYSQLSKTYDQDSRLVTISDQYTTDLSATSLASFESRAQQLVDELNNLGTNAENLKYGDIVKAGVLEIDISADALVTAFILGYGLTDWVTVLGIFPYQRAAVTVKSRITGVNNAALVKEELGGIAPPEMQAGLSELSKLNEQTFIDMIKEKGYQDPTYWTSEGWRDFYLGVRLQPFFNPYVATGGMAFIKIPTGKTENPDELTSLPFGEGNIGFLLQPSVDITFFPGWLVALTLDWRLELAAEIEKRVPHDESDFLPGIDQKRLRDVEKNKSPRLNCNAVDPV